MNATYPKAPGFKATDTETSWQAADDMKCDAATLREQVLKILARFENSTPDEAAAFLGVDKLSIRPRFSELVAMGKVEDSGVRRLNTSKKKAVAWRLVQTPKQQDLFDSKAV